MKRILVLLVVISFTRLCAQTTNTGNITVTVRNENKDALENTTVQLIKGADSSLVKVAITDGQGIAEFEHIAFGSYLIKATMVNYTAAYSALFNVSSGGQLRIPVSLTKKSSEMKEVIVEGKKPLIQKLSDRIVVNVDNSIISAGSSAMDVLERSAGVNIGQDDAIS